MGVRISTRRQPNDFDANRAYWVSPDRIEYVHTWPDYNGKCAESARVIGGNWDNKIVRLTELKPFRVPQESPTRNSLWEETEHYGRVLSDDEVTVCIDRNGTLLLEGGGYRLATTKLFGVDKIPVKIIARHSQWYRFRNEVIDYARTHGGKIYQSISHPDLCDIPSAHSDARFRIIRAHLPVQSGDLLDIGAHWGYFCHRFEEEGFNCHAVENDTTHLYFLEKLKKAERRKFTIISKSIFDYHDKTDFDVVLALNIFHHFLKTEERYRALVALLGRLDMRVMFFQAHNPGEPQMRGAYRNYECGEFVRFISENSCLGKAMHIGTPPDGRPLYLLSKS